MTTRETAALASGGPPGPAARTPQRTAPRPGTRGRSRRGFAAAALSFLAGSVLGGCAEPVARATLLNTTDRTLSVSVWPAGGDSIRGEERGEERILTEDGATYYRFEYEGDEPQLAVWAKTEEGSTHLTTLEPPGPHLVEIRGSAGGLQFVVRRDPGDPGDRVPDDARRRGFNEDIPPVNPPPPGP